MDVFEAMKRRRMHRAFTGEPVDHDVIDRLIWAAARAPMGGKQLVRHFVVVTNPALVTTIREVTPSLLAHAPVLILICTDIQLAEETMGTQGRDILSLTDAGAAAENIALAAVALGLGVCFVRSSNEEALRVVLELPSTVRPDLLVAVGHPVPKPPHTHRAPKPVTFRDVYGQPWEKNG